MKYTIVVVLTLFSTLSFAGAWGVESFENDSALDWSYELETSKGVEFLAETFNRIKGKPYLEADECSAVLAAADVLQSIRNASYEHLPENVKDWASKNNDSESSRFLQDALEAINACINVQNSELAQLWSESSAQEWRRVVENLKVKLR